MVRPRPPGQPGAARRPAGDRGAVRRVPAEENGASQPSWHGFRTKTLRNGVLTPRYYDPEVDRELAALRETHTLVVLGDLAADGRLELRTGDEVGKLGYGRDGVPFVRTSDISTWEINVDPKHRVERPVYEKLRAKQDVRENADSFGRRVLELILPFRAPSASARGSRPW